MWKRGKTPMQQTKIYFEAKQSGMPPHPCFIMVDLEETSGFGFKSDDGNIILHMKSTISEKETKELASLLGQAVETISYQEI
jgi:hypothetical protein